MTARTPQEIAEAKIAEWLEKWRLILQPRMKLDLTHRIAAAIEAERAENAKLRGEISYLTDEVVPALRKEIEATTRENVRLSWVMISNLGDLPKKPGKAAYETIDCLIFFKGEVIRSMWNCEHGCWDDAEGDDYAFDPLQPSHYLIIQPPRSALSETDHG
jgi:hypothetical protein